MNNNRNLWAKLVLISVLIVSAAVFMCACGGSSSGSGKTDLESHFKEHPEDLQDIKDGISQDEDMKDILDTIEFDAYAKGNTLYYIYKFKATYDEDQTSAVKESLEGALDDMEEEMPDNIAKIEKGFGVDGIKIHMEYQNGDGSVIAERDFSK